VLADAYWARTAALANVEPGVLGTAPDVGERPRHARDEAADDIPWRDQLVKTRTISVMVGTALASIALAASASAAPSNGVANGAGAGGGLQPAGAALPIPGDVNFDNIDAPCLFSETVPLTQLDGVKFKGNGSVVNQCGNWGVSGFSAPNFLGFNDGAVDSNGAVPSLPEKIILPGTFSGVSISVASQGSAGRILKVKGKGLTAETHLVTLAPGVQTVSFSIPVKSIQLSSASASAPVDLMIADDIVY
jgi:hypothetical protein